MLIISSIRGSWLKYLLFCSYKPCSYGQFVLSHYLKDYLTYKQGIEHSSWDTIAFVSVKEKHIYSTEKDSNEDATYKEHFAENVKKEPKGTSCSRSVLWKLLALHHI